MEVKKKHNRIVSLVLSLFIVLNLFTAGVPTFADVGGDYEYTVNMDQVTCTINKYTGVGGIVSIPSSLNGYQVSAIGNNAFKNNKSITNLTIPNTVTTIGEYSFYGMTNLTDVSIPNSVTTIEAYAFQLDEKLLDIKLPERITTIGNQAFSNCYKLGNINLPNSITSMGYAILSNCQKIKTVTIPNQMTYVPNQMFVDCYALETVYIPSSVTEIEPWAFHRCGIKALSIPSSVTKIGQCALYDCDHLTEIYVNGTPEINKDVFGTFGYNTPPIIYSATETTMSAFSCTVLPQHTITPEVVSGGAIVPTALAGMKDQYVHIDLVPQEGYTPDMSLFKYNAGSGDVLITDSKIKMPDSPVTLKGGFVPIPVPSVNTTSATTTNLKPIWTWTDGTGESYFRYKLDGGPWNYTTAMSFTPKTDLVSGGHTLIVENMNALGYWSVGSSSTLTILPTVTGVSVSPIAAQILKGTTQSFTATVSGTALPPQGVTWSVSGGGSGTSVNSSGLLTVGANESANQLTVKATSIFDTSKSGSVTATLLNPPPTPLNPPNPAPPVGGKDKKEKTSNTKTADVPATVKVYTTVAKLVGGSSLSGNLVVAVDPSASRAVLDLTTQQEQLKNGESFIVNVPPMEGVTKYTLSLPAAYLSASKMDKTLTINTSKGSLILPTDILVGLQGVSDKVVKIDINRVEKSGLSDALKRAIGERPLFEISLSVDGKEIHWQNEKKSVTMAIKYTPTEAELKNPESLVIWYIDEKGNQTPVPNSRYNSKMGAMTFTTTHFSNFGTGFNPITFSDVPQGAWYEKAVRFVAARGILTGTGKGQFNPEEKLTRGDFLVMVMKAYGLSAEKASTGNFIDAGNTYYTDYLSTAKKLGITNGVGGNRFAPNRLISEQEMYGLLTKTLKATNQLPEKVKVFNNGQKSPLTVTRAELAQMLYLLLAQ